MSGMGEAVAAELLAEAVMSSVGWLQRAARRRPDESGHAPLARGEIDMLRPIIADYLRQSLNLDVTQAAGVDAYLVSGEFRLLLDHVLACLLLEQSVSGDSAPARLCSAGLQRFLPSDTATDAFGVSFFAVMVAACRVVIDSYLPEDYQPDQGAVDGSYLRQLQLYVGAIEDHLHCLVRQGAPSRGDYEQFFTKALRVTKQVHGRVVPPAFDGARPVAIDRIFVTPHLKVSSAPRHATLLFDVFVDSVSRAVVLGDPGGGKTTLAQKLAYDLAERSLRGPTDGTVDRRVLPVVVVVRDYAAARRARGLSVIDYIETASRAKHQLNPPAGAYEWLLTTGRLFLIFDGLDEVLETRDRAEMAGVVETFASLYPATRILVTSRRVGYTEAPLDEDMFQPYDLVEFDERQVRDYADKWFRMGHGGARMVDRFMIDSELVPDLRSNALMLALMCNIYRIEGYIPRNRPDVYEKCALMLFERWDRARGIEVLLPFEAHVGPAMRHFAHWIYSDTTLQSGVTESALIDVATDYLRRRFEDEDEARSGARDFVDFCRGRAWVFTDVGLTPEGEAIYQFTHRTFLEYFTALHLTRLSDSNRALVRSLLPRIRRAEWDVVAQLAVQISARQRENGADESLEIMLEAAEKARSEKSRRNVLDFALRCLTFLVPRPDVVRRIVSAAVVTIIDAAAAPQRMRRKVDHQGSRFTSLFRVARENRVVAFNEVEGALESVYSSGDPARKHAALAHLATARLNGFRPSSEDENEDETPDYLRNVQQTLYAQARQACVECLPEHPWIGIWGFWNELISLDQLHETHGDGALFMRGYAEQVSTTYVPLCDGALSNAMRTKYRTSDNRYEHVLTIAYEMVVRHRGQLQLTPAHLSGYIGTHLIDHVFGVTTNLPLPETLTYRRVLAPRYRRRSCWLLAACIERDEHSDDSGPKSAMLAIPLAPDRPRNALEAVAIARNRSRQAEGPIRQLHDAARQRAQDVLADVDPELVLWARRDLQIWARPDDPLGVRRP